MARPASQPAPYPLDPPQRGRCMGCQQDAALTWIAPQRTPRTGHATLEWRCCSLECAQRWQKRLAASYHSVN